MWGASDYTLRRSARLTVNSGPKEGTVSCLTGRGLDYPVTAWIQGFTQLHTFGAAQNTAAPAPAARVSRKITVLMKSESLSMLPPVLVLLRFTVVVELTGPGLNSQVQG